MCDYIYKMGRMCVSIVLIAHFIFVSIFQIARAAAVFNVDEIVVFDETNSLSRYGLLKYK